MGDLLAYGIFWLGAIAIGIWAIGKTIVHLFDRN